MDAATLSIGKVCTESLDATRAKSLLEAAFGRKLRDSYKLQGEYALVAGNYDAMALVKKTPLASYLDKFAVAPSLQGNGMGKKLWKTLCKTENKLFWRSKKSNPINEWYEKKADGKAARGKWVVYWKNLNGEEAKKVILFAALLPESFE